MKKYLTTYFIFLLITSQFSVLWSYSPVFRIRIQDPGVVTGSQIFRIRTVPQHCQSLFINQPHTQMLPLYGQFNIGQFWISNISWLYRNNFKFKFNWIQITFIQILFCIALYFFLMFFFLICSRSFDHKAAGRGEGDRTGQDRLKHLTDPFTD